MNVKYWRRLLHSSIKTKLVVFVLTVVSISFLFMACATIYYYKGRAETEYTSEMRTLGDIVASNSAAAIAFNNTTYLNNFLASLRSYHSIQRICIFDGNKGLFSELADQEHNKNCEKVQPINFDGEKNYIVITSILQNATELGKVVLYADRYSYARYISSAALITLFVFPMFILAILLPLAVYLQRYVSRPISNAIAVSRHIAREDEKLLSVNEFESLAFYLGKIKTYVSQLENDYSQLLQLNTGLSKNILVCFAVLSEESKQCRVSSDIGVKLIKSKEVTLKDAGMLYEVTQQLTKQLQRTVTTIKKSLVTEDTIQNRQYNKIFIEKAFVDFADSFFPAFNKKNVIISGITSTECYINIEHFKKFILTIFIIFNELFYGDDSKYSLVISCEEFCQLPINNCKEFTISISNNSHPHDIKERFRLITGEFSDVQEAEQSASYQKDIRLKELLLQATFYANMNYGGADSALAFEFFEGDIKVKYKIFESVMYENR